LVSLTGAFRKDEYLKGKLTVEHAAGLGPKPNVIPPGEISITGEFRPVEIGWHPVAGLAGKWFAEKTGLDSHPFSGEAKATCKY